MHPKTSIPVAASRANVTTTVRSNWIRQRAQLSADKTERFGPARSFRRVAIALTLAVATSLPLMAEVPKQARTAIDRTIGSPGTYIPEEGVYKIVLPKPEATVVLDYQTLSPNFGLNSWVSVASAVHHEAFLTGQLLLLEDEVNPVMTTVLNAGLEITGLADSSTFDGPRLKTLDVTGVGTYQSLASGFRKALDEIRRAC